MEGSDLLSFTPVPLRLRQDGWTAKRQRAFVDYLRRGLRPGAAARMVGMSRQTAYALRARPGGAGFAAAWDRATAQARRERAGRRRPTDWARGVDGVERAVRYRGRVVAVERRLDDAAFLRLLRRLDRILEKREAEEADYFAFGDLNFCQLPAVSAAEPRKMGD